ncbi:GIY-YIG nuclease family protein [Sphingomonas sp.]|uniref:GIY-YIG nuclease family protein n=1 Tax=Sphingomonas sp. TaxID=28214 RepID=UPI002DD691ED|nr:GIY-YIG nuclease family protein [Sphingomonas sp.]
MKAGYVYMMASRRNGTIYTGSTSGLMQRVWQHRNRVADSFTDAHECTLLVWYEVHDDLQEARLRERRIKKWNRPWKLRLIEEMNPRWDDLYDRIAAP